MWTVQKQERLRLGDDLAAPRPVEHFAYFSRKARAAAAADELSAAGFVVSTARTGLRTALCAERHEPLDDADVLRFLSEVIAVVESHGGEYDGWGAATAG